MPHLRSVILVPLLALVACGGRAGLGAGAADGGTPSDASVCPSPAPTEGASCSADSTQPCAYDLPGPCPGARDICRCMNGSWHCEVTLLDGGPCGSSGDAAADGPLAALCTGTFSRMAVNGIDSNPSVQGAMLPYQCCYAAELVAVTQTVPITMVPIVVTWSVQVGSATPIPATIDLANPPAGWTVAVDVGCDPAQAGCYPAPDSYTTGFTGTLQIERTSSGGFDTSLCLSVAEPAGSPHPLVHSLELYAPHVPSG